MQLFGGARKTSTFFRLVRFFVTDVKILFLVFLVPRIRFNRLKTQGGLR